jgi:hypothetical protein
MGQQSRQTASRQWAIKGKKGEKVKGGSRFSLLFCTFAR